MFAAHLTKLLPFAVCLVIFLWDPHAAQAQSFTLDPPLPSRMTVGESITVKAKLTAPTATPLSIENIQWLGIEGCLIISNKVDEGGGVYSFTLTALKVCDGFVVTVKIGEAENKFTVFIVPALSIDQFDPATLPPKDLQIKQQSEATVKLRLKDGSAIPGGALKATSDAPEIALVSLADSTMVITGRKPGTAAVTISAYDKVVHSFQVRVTETLQEIKAGDLKFTNGDSPKPLNELGIELVGKEGTIWKKDDAIARLNFFSNKSSVARISSDGTKLEIVDAGDAQLQISAKDDPTKSKIINITVAPKAAVIRFGTESNFSILANSPAKTVRATVLDSANRSVPGTVLKFECERPNCDGIVNITPLADNAVEIKALKAGSARITAKLEGHDDVSPQNIVVTVVDSGQITTFKPLQIRLDMLDEQAARDLFGRKANDEYYIAKVQLFNRIKKTDTEFFGDSILVYSESLQVRVALELKCRDENTFTECAGKKNRWVPVTLKMIQDQFFDSKFSLAPPMSQTEATSDLNEAQTCTVQAPKNFVGLYRPYSFDTVAVTHDRRDERSLRSRILTVLNGAISFTSFVTAIAVPGPGSDLPLGLDKSNNLLIPSFEKLFPSMKEVQRQNILTMVMRNLEEIPFGGNIERKIFFPKGALEGLWPGHRVRISAVSIFDACAQVAIIKKVGGAP